MEYLCTGFMQNRFMIRFNRGCHRDIYRIALPATLSNITVPLLSLVDLSIVGHLGSPTYLGAISVGGTIFNMLYWVFAFLRMGTTGLTSQAYGRQDEREMEGCLVRAVTVGLGVSVTLLCLQWPLQEMLLTLIGAEGGVRQYAALYYRICIWGAPAVLCQYALTGWFIGMQEARCPLYVALFQNIVNIGCSLFFVYVWNRGVAGVAAGTVVAQYAGLLLAVFWVVRLRQGRQESIRAVCWKGYFTWTLLRRFFRVNRDIFLRTLCLVAVTTYFTSAGARQGEVVLAMNAVMMQFFLLYSFFMDGIAYAGEALAGRFQGAGDYRQMSVCIRNLFQWGSVVALVFTLFYGLGGQWFMGILTDETEVLCMAARYWGWTVVIPIAGMAAFLWDGVFIGLTATRQMLLAMAGSAVLFFLFFFLGEPLWGNHALWLAFIVYLLARGCMETWLYRRLKKHGA